MGHVDVPGSYARPYHSTHRATFPRRESVRAARWSRTGGATQACTAPRCAASAPAATQYARAMDRDVHGAAELQDMRSCIALGTALRRRQYCPLRILSAPCGCGVRVPHPAARADRPTHYALPIVHYLKGGPTHLSRIRACACALPLALCPPATPDPCSIVPRVLSLIHI